MIKKKQGYVGIYMGNNKRKTPSLRRIFCALTTIFTVAALGTAALIGTIRHKADKTDEILASIGMTTSELKSIYHEPLMVTHYEDKMTEWAAITSLDFGYAGKMKESREELSSSGAYDHHLGSQGGNVWQIEMENSNNLIMSALSDHLFPSIVTMPQETISKDDIINIFTGLNPDKLRAKGTDINLPGTAEDYRKIIFLHEVEHSHHGHMSSSLYKEYAADSKAIQHYLELGGREDVAQAYIALRAIDAIRFSFYHALYTGETREDMTYFHALALNNNMDEDAQFTMRDNLQGHDDLTTALFEIKKSTHLHTLDFDNSNAHDLYLLCLAANIDPSVTLSAPAKKLQEMFIAGYDVIMGRGEDMKNNTIENIKEDMKQLELTKKSEEKPLIDTQAQQNTSDQLSAATPETPIPGPS